jgi:hypothetical protein
VSGKLPVRRLVRVKTSEDVALTRLLHSPLVQHLRESRRGQRKRRGRGSALLRKPSNRSPNPKIFLPGCATIVDSPGHFANECPKPRQQKLQQHKQNPGSAINNYDNKPSPQVEQSQLNLLGNTSIPEPFLTSPCNFESRDEILLKGGRL